MDDEDIILVTSTVLTLGCAIQLHSNQSSKKTRNRKVWIKQWLQDKEAKGANSNYPKRTTT